MHEIGSQVKTYVIASVPKTKGTRQFNGKVQI
jgi:hypothetical protein